MTTWPAIQRDRDQPTRVDAAELRTLDGEVLRRWEAVDGEVWVPNPDDIPEMGPGFAGRLVMLGGAGKHGGRLVEQTVLRWQP